MFSEIKERAQYIKRMKYCSWRYCFYNAASLILPIYHIVEYPKCGATWFRKMLEIALGLDDNYEKGELKRDMQLLHRHCIYNSLIQRPIFVLRDPADVLTSFFFHENFLDGMLRENLLYGFDPCDPDDVNIFRYVRAKTELPYESYPYCTYSQMIESWKKKLGDRFVYVRYEALHKDPLSEIGRVLDYYDLKCSDDKILNAVEKNSFVKATSGRRSGMEDRFSHKRKGVVGDHLTYFTEEMIGYVRDKYSYIYENFYSDDLIS